MERAITEFYRDDEGDWVAELDCGHTRHVRHDPPWQLRPWMTSEEERNKRIGRKVNCKKCDRLNREED